MEYKNKNGPEFCKTPDRREIEIPSHKNFENNHRKPKLERQPVASDSDQIERRFEAQPNDWCLIANIGSNQRIIADPFRLEYVLQRSGHLTLSDQRWRSGRRFKTRPVLLEFLAAQNSLSPELEKRLARVPFTLAGGWAHE